MCFVQSKWFGTLWNSRRSDATRTMTEPNAYKNKYQNENHKKNKRFCSRKHPEATTNTREAPDTKNIMKFRLFGLEMNRFLKGNQISESSPRTTRGQQKKHNKSYVFFCSVKVLRAALHYIKHTDCDISNMQIVTSNMRIASYQTCELR